LKNNSDNPVGTSKRTFQGYSSLFKFIWMNSVPQTTETNGKILIKEGDFGNPSTFLKN